MKSTKNLISVSLIAAVLFLALPVHAALTALPSPALKGETSLEEALANRRSIRSFTSEPLKMKDVSQLLWAAQGITGPGGKRTAPSARAIYPLSIYLVAGSVEGLKPGVYRYIPEKNSIEGVAEGDLRATLVQNAQMQPWIQDSPAMIVITVNYKMMGDADSRGRMMADFEIGHVAQNALLEAVALHLGAVPVASFNAETLGKSINLPSPFVAAYLLPIGHPKAAASQR